MFKINIASFLLTGIVIFSSCKSDPQNTAGRQKFVISDSLLRTLQIDSITKCQMISTLTLTGKVTFDEDKVARIYPMVSGNISNVNAQLGDYVQKGQKLGVINSAEMAGYGSDLATSEANLLISKKNLEASEDMYKGGLLSQKDFVTAQELYKQSESQLKRSGEVLRINGGNMQGEFVVKSPISGFIVEKQINNNMAIRNDNNNIIFTISDLKDVWIMANVYESNISQVHLSDSVEVTTLSYPGKIFYGKIDQILNVLDPTNKVMKIRVVLSNPGYSLKPGMFASVTAINRSNYNALCVPSSTLIFDQSQYFILVYKNQKQVNTMPVQVISTHANKSYITGNVQEGNRVIASDAVLIYNELNN